MNTIDTTIPGKENKFLIDPDFIPEDGTQDTRIVQNINSSFKEEPLDSQE